MGLTTSTLLTAASLGLQASSAITGLRNSKKAASAQRREGEIQAAERQKRAKRLASSQKASFLASGISLTGDGTADAVLADTFDTGMEDINLINENTKNRVGNTTSQGRANFIGSLGNMATTAIDKFDFDLTRL